MFLAESSVLSSLTSISESFSFFDNFRAFTLLHRLQITISSKLYRCMTLKYFFYHQIFFQDSAQTEKLTVFSNPKYTAWTFWNTEHEHFEILSMKLNCKYWECMDWNPRNTDVPTSVFRRYCDTLLYTARSQHAEIENSHSQRGKSEQALLKLYSNFFSHPPEAR